MRVVPRAAEGGYWRFDFQAGATAAFWHVTPQNSTLRVVKSTPQKPHRRGNNSVLVQRRQAPVLIARAPRSAASALSNLGSMGSKIPGVSYVAGKVGDVLGLPKLPANTNPYDTVQHSTATNAAVANQTVGGKVGTGAENIAEFFMGDEALKGLSLAEKAGILAKVAKVAESHPIVAKIISHGLTAVRGGAVTTGQQLAHGATPTQALEAGAGATVLGTAAGAATEGVGAGIKAIKSAVNPEIADGIGLAKRVAQGSRAAQPGAQAAVRGGVQSSIDADAANLAPISPVDKYPVSMELDAKGNLLKADGRHRLVQAWERGDKSIPVTVKLADGTTTIANQPVQEMATKMGLGDTVQEARQSLNETDAQQAASRAAEGKPTDGTPRPPVYETPKVSPDMTPVKLDTNKPLVKGAETFMDDHLSNLAKKEQAAYKTVDETAGFDVKAEKAQLANDQYKLKQLGNTDADVTARGNLIESINDSTDRIANAEAKMKAAGIDPQFADSLHKQRMAGLDFKKSLIKNTNPADQSVNVQGLLKDAKNFRFSKYGDRLEQFMGSKEAADNYVAELEKMDKLGAHALKVQKAAQMLGKWAASGAVGGGVGTGAYELAHRYLGNATVPQ